MAEHPSAWGGVKLSLNFPFNKNPLPRSHFPSRQHKIDCWMHPTKRSRSFPGALAASLHPWPRPRRPRQHPSLAWANPTLLAIFNFPLDPPLGVPLSGSSSICRDSREMASAAGLSPRVGSHYVRGRSTEGNRWRRRDLMMPTQCSSQMCERINYTVYAGFSHPNRCSVMRCGPAIFLADWHRCLDFCV